MRPKEVIVFYNNDIASIFRSGYYPFIVKVLDRPPHLSMGPGIVVEDRDGRPCHLFPGEYVPANKFFRRLYNV